MATMKAADVSMTLEKRSGCVTSLRVGRGRIQMAKAAPAGFLAIDDLRARRHYDPVTTPPAVSGWKAPPAGKAGRITFAQQYDGAPFRIEQTFRQSRAGIRWEAALKLLDDSGGNRSVRVTWVLPIPQGWAFWAPQDTEVLRNDGVTPRRYVYGHTSFRPYGTAIPLVATWGDRAGLAAFSPPDVQKPYISFDLQTQHAPNWVRGISPTGGEAPQLHVTHHLVGLRPGRTLRLAVCLAGIRPDWRSALGHYVGAYPKLFEPVAATRKVEGMYGITTPTRLAGGELDRLRAAGVTFAEVHGHFPEYSVFIEPESLADPKRSWRCKPHPGKRLSLADNRRWIRRLSAAGIAPFMYWYNCHALPGTIRKRWPGAAMADERGRVMLKWYTEPAVWGPPDSPFGKHTIRQMELLLKAYPRAAGFFVDNFAVEMLDFGHDDGVTMVHDRSVYDLNRNHQLLGPPCFEKAHRAGKIIMVNKISTIESLRGADMVLAETRGVASLRKHALACVYRPLFPLAMELPAGPHGAERGLQHLLLNGCTPDEDLYRKDPEAMAAYRPLTDAMIGKRWVLDFRPLDVPEGLDGEIFRIDRAAPRGGSVVVALVDLRRSWKDGQLTDGLSVTVRLPEQARYKRATWLGVEASDRRAVACRITRRGQAMTAHLPPAGAAGLLRLSR